MSRHRLEPLHLHSAKNGWAFLSFENYMLQSARLSEVTELSINSISIVQNMPNILEVLLRVAEEDESKRKEKIEKAKETASLAKREIDHGFPLIYSHAIIGLWSLLEASVNEFCAIWLQKKHSLLANANIDKLKIRFGEYDRLRGINRYRYLVNCVDRDLCAGARNGYERLEKLMEVMSLPGQVPKKLERDLVEFSNVRNSIVHCGYALDDKLLKKCPWLKKEIKKTYATSIMFDRYSIAAAHYVVLLICRLGISFGEDMTKEAAKVFETYK